MAAQRWLNGSVGLQLEASLPVPGLERAERTRLRPDEALVQETDTFTGTSETPRAETASEEKKRQRVQTRAELMNASNV